MDSQDTQRDPTQKGTQGEVLGWKKSSWTFAGMVIFVLAVMLGAVVTPWLFILFLPALACLAVSGKLDAFYHLCGPDRPSLI